MPETSVPETPGPDPLSPDPLSQVANGKAPRQPFFNGQDWLILSLVGVNVAVFGLQLAAPGLNLAVSADALRQGRANTLLTSMFAHGGLMHIASNMIALMSIGPQLKTLLPSGGRGKLGFAALYFITGLIGSFGFLALHLNHHAAALGASGAICGIWGATVRLASPHSLRTRIVWSNIRSLLVWNVVLGGLLWLAGGALAWEAHIAAFVTGLLIAKPVVRMLGGTVGEPIGALD